MYIPLYTLSIYKFYLSIILQQSWGKTKLKKKNGLSRENGSFWPDQKKERPKDLKILRRRAES